MEKKINNGLNLKRIQCEEIFQQDRVWAETFEVCDEELERARSQALSYCRRGEDN